MPSGAKAQHLLNRVFGTVENRVSYPATKDGAPDPLWQGKKYSPLPFDLSLVFITLGEPQAHGDTAEAVPFLQRLFPKKKWKPLCLREMRAVWRKRGEASAAGDLNGDAFSSKNQGVDGPCTGAEHGQTDGEHSNQNVTLVMCWT